MRRPRAAAPPGVLVVHETAPASYGWTRSRTPTPTRCSTSSARTRRPSTPPSRAGSSATLAEQTLRGSGAGLRAAEGRRRRRDFQPVPLKATLNANVQAKTETINSHNVVGLLPGKKHPDETVIYTAHWDHLGIGKPDANGDKIYNGAVDNATGIAQLIEQARAFAEARGPTVRSSSSQSPPRRRACWVPNITRPTRSTRSARRWASSTWTRWALGGRRRTSPSPGPPSSTCSTIWSRKGKRQGRYFTADPHPETGGFFRSDHFSFAKVGVPAISFKPGNDLVKGGTARGEALDKEYTEKRYHQPDDEFDPQWDFSGMAEDAQLLHLVGEQLANSREWPNWSADSEFRATRDQSAAERSGAAPAAPETVPEPKKGERG